LRNEAIAAMILPDLHASSTAGHWTPDTVRMCFDPTLLLSARANRRGIISILDAHGEQQIAHVPDLTTAMEIRFSPDSRTVVVSTNLLGGAIQAWRVVDRADTGDPQPIDRSIFDALLTDCTQFDVSADGRRLAVGRLDGSVTVHDLQTGEQLCRLPLEDDPYCLAFHPDTTRLAVCCRGQTARVEVWNVDTAAMVAELTSPAGEVKCIAWHPEGELLAIGVKAADNRAEIWDVAAQQRVAVMEGHAHDLTWVGFNATGGLLCTSLISAAINCNPTNL
jgi:WD40 repeat protein